MNHRSFTKSPDSRANARNTLCKGAREFNKFAVLLKKKSSLGLIRSPLFLLSTSVLRSNAFSRLSYGKFLIDNTSFVALC